MAYRQDISLVKAPLLLCLLCELCFVFTFTEARPLMKISSGPRVAINTDGVVDYEYLTWEEVQNLTTGNWEIAHPEKFVQTSCSEENVQDAFKCLISDSDPYLSSINSDGEATLLREILKAIVNSAEQPIKPILELALLGEIENRKDFDDDSTTASPVDTEAQQVNPGNGPSVDVPLLLGIIGSLVGINLILTVGILMSFMRKRQPPGERISKGETINEVNILEPRYTVADLPEHSL